MVRLRRRTVRDVYAMIRRRRSVQTMTIRLSCLVPIVLAAAVTTAACSSAGSSGSAVTATFACPETDPTSPQNGACVSCLSSQCNSELTTAFGSEWASGEYAGICVSYIECIEKCACSDPACATHCQGATSAGCMSGLSGTSTCIARFCEAPCNPPMDGGASGLQPPTD